jgi:hypothetical protein
MKRNNNEMRFVPTTTVNIIEMPFTDNRYVQANQLLFFKGFYRVGKLLTDLNNPVTALKFIPNSMDIILVEPLPGTHEARNIFTEHPHTILLDLLNMPHDQIIPEYNCHGHCFGNSQFRIPDASQILLDEYEETDEANAECVVFYENNVTVHSAILKNGQIIAKGGFRGLNHYDTVLNSITPDIRYTRHVFFRKKTMPNNYFA